MIDVESLGNWRDVRRSLGKSFAFESTQEQPFVATELQQAIRSENEAVLQTQNEELAHEYRTGVWAHEIALVRTSLEPFSSIDFRTLTHRHYARSLQMIYSPNWAD